MALRTEHKLILTWVKTQVWCIVVEAKLHWLDLVLDRRELLDQCVVSVVDVLCVLLEDVGDFGDGGTFYMG